VSRGQPQSPTGEAFAAAWSGWDDQLHVRTLFNPPLPLGPPDAKHLRQGFSFDGLQDVAVEAREAGLGEEVDDGRHLEQPDRGSPGGGNTSYTAMLGGI
jgi:hypothetical protein